MQGCQANGDDDENSDNVIMIHTHIHIFKNFFL
jgi:hypothetical protein